MSVSSLKSEIIDRVSSLNDKKLLEEIKEFIDFEIETESVYKLSQEEKASIQKGLEDINNGKVFTNDSAEKMLNQWLEK